MHFHVEVTLTSLLPVDENTRERYFLTNEIRISISTFCCPSASAYGNITTKINREYKDPVVDSHEDMPIKS